MTQNKNPEKMNSTAGEVYVDQRQPFEITCPARLNEGLIPNSVHLLPYYTKNSEILPHSGAITDDGQKRPPGINPILGEYPDSFSPNSYWVCSLSNQPGPDCYSCMQNKGYLLPHEHKVKKNTKTTTSQEQ